MAVTDGDEGRLRRVTHELRGALALLQANPAGEAVRQLEAMARKGSLARAQGVLARLEQHVEEVRQALEDLARHPEPPALAADPGGRTSR